MKNNSFLYIEPYVHIELMENIILCYNMLDGSYIKSNKKNVINLFYQFMKKSNDFFINFSEIKDNNEEVSSFIKKMRDLYMCDYIEKNDKKKLPVIFKNEISVKNSVKNFSLKNISERNINYLYSCLREITIVVNNYDHDKNLNIRYFQANSKSEKFKAKNQLSKEYLDIIYNHVIYCAVECVNIVGSNVLDYSHLLELINSMSKFDVLKIININCSDLTSFIKNGITNRWEELFNTVEKEYLILSIFIDNLTTKEDLLLIEEFKTKFNLNIEFKFIIENSNDFLKSQSFIKYFKDNNFVFHPFFNGYNEDFFENNIFLDENDIMDITPLDTKEILTRSKINPNYYSKLIFMWNGDIYSNVHKNKIGNLKVNNLYEIIYQELNSDTWNNTRNKVEPCKDCIFNIFCPSISNFEYDFGRNNLCKICN